MLSIKQRQYDLKAFYNFYKGEIDGKEGPLMKEAYRSFQKLKDLSIDGKYGSKTNESLVNTINDIQRSLNRFGYNLDIDSVAGPKTINAIKDFQKKNNLQVNSYVDFETLEKLNTKSWDDIKHFKKSEFTCKCGCGMNNINLDLVYILEDIRNHFGNNPLNISSGCRCKEHNKKVGGVSNSRHLLGKASDIHIKNVSCSDLLAYCKTLVKKGVLRYTYTNNKNMKGAVHIDIK